MEIILLENIRNVGSFGAKVKVSAGYGRNYLIPFGKAVAATKNNLVEFEARRAELEKAANDKLSTANERGEALNELVVTIVANASEEGKLYGSIGTHDIVVAIKEAKNIDVSRGEVSLPHGNIREIGETEVVLQLHAEVAVAITVKVIPEEN